MAAAGGSTLRSLLGSRVMTGDLSLSMGADTRRASIYGTFSMARGATQYGLPLSQYSFGVDVLFPIGPLRLGLGPRVGYATIDRATTSRDFELVSLGLVGQVSVDMVNTGTFALSAALVPSLETLTKFQLLTESSPAGLYGIGLRLQARFRAPRESDLRQKRDARRD
jgi:hypothetical protein